MLWDGILSDSYTYSYSPKGLTYYLLDVIKSVHECVMLRVMSLVT